MVLLVHLLLYFFQVLAQLYKFKNRQAPNVIKTCRQILCQYDARFPQFCGVAQPYSSP